MKFCLFLHLGQAGEKLPAWAVLSWSDMLNASECYNERINKQEKIMIVDFDDIKKAALVNHDIDSCVEYLLDAYEQAQHGVSTVASGKDDDARETCREGLGEAFHYTGKEQHEFIAKYVYMVAPDRFENEIEEYKQGVE